MYGTQAVIINLYNSCLFENDVKMYGTQADEHETVTKEGLRMM